MKYLVRAVKYFFWFAIILCITMAIMAAIGLVEPKPELMFREGWKSLWQIALLFAIVAIAYPRFGFTSREIEIPEERENIREDIINCMESRGYRLEKEDGEHMTFRLRSKVSAAFKMFEDRITFTRTPKGYSAEGLTKEIVRVVGAIEYKFRETIDN